MAHLPHRSDQQEEGAVGVLPHRAEVVEGVEAAEEEAEEAAVEEEEAEEAAEEVVVQLVRCWRLPLGGSCRIRGRRCR